MTALPNQCDGCLAGHNLRNDLHVGADGRAYMACQKLRYSAPIDMVLHCPACRMQHIDMPEACPDEGCDHYGTPHGHPDLWTNPPHRSHLCHGCGLIWRPADVPTNGVAAVKTKGSADSPILHYFGPGATIEYKLPGPLVWDEKESS